MQSTSQSYIIGGVPLQYPHKAYPSQINMMDRIIRSLQRKQSCLIESPTGTGKSLALLCSCLAWQRNEAAKLKEAVDNINANPAIRIEPEQLETQQSSTKASHQAQTFTSSTAYDSDDDDFMPDKRSVKKAKDPQAMEVQHLLSEPFGGIGRNNQPPEVVPRLKRPPKIYFGTRTHKQITQLIGELRKTAYSDVPMTILASREHTCVHPHVRKEPNKTEACKQLLDNMDGNGCTFYTKLKARYDHPHRIRELIAANLEDSGAWDIEDLTAVGTDAGFCPYFSASRVLTTDAQLIFCPYNYLVDPLIKNSMMLTLKDEIVILDEAHNIEDCCRDAASFQIMFDELADACTDFENLVSFNIDLSCVVPLSECLSAVQRWAAQQIQAGVLKERSHDCHTATWEGPDIVAIMKSLQLEPDKLPNLRACLTELTKPDVDEAGRRKKGPPKVQAQVQSLIVVEKILYFLDYLYKSKMKYVDDFRLCIIREAVYSRSPDKSGKSSRWPGRSQRQRRSTTHQMSLNFWCMNPGVAFSDIGEVAHSVVLASGTLCPLETFQSELNMAFPFKLEAAHILPKERSFIATLSAGPRAKTLRAVYTQTDTFDFQDEVGLSVLRICQVMPFGILCFFPSYKMLEKLQQRWRETGLWHQLIQIKQVVIEPRSGEDLKDVMSTFYAAIENSKQFGASCTGALFLAVCRGKVSEGLDFADNNARAVITIGIPYPNVGDLQVELKRKYNDRFAISKRLLSGGQWYEIQAFRALNQALGRCLRHLNDWGAIILIDERFSQQPGKYCSNISKWVRERVKHFSKFEELLVGLAAFGRHFELEHSSPPTPVESPIQAVHVQRSPVTSKYFSSSPLSSMQPVALISEESALRPHDTFYENFQNASQLSGESFASVIPESPDITLTVLTSSAAELDRTANFSGTADAKSPVFTSKRAIDSDQTLLSTKRSRLMRSLFGVTDNVESMEHEQKSFNNSQSKQLVQCPQCSANLCSLKSVEHPGEQIVISLLPERLRQMQNDVCAVRYSDIAHSVQLSTGPIIDTGIPLNSYWDDANQACFQVCICKEQGCGRIIGCHLVACMHPTFDPWRNWVFLSFAPDPTCNK